MCVVVATTFRLINSRKTACSAAKNQETLSEKNRTCFQAFLVRTIMITRMAINGSTPKQSSRITMLKLHSDLPLLG